MSSIILWSTEQKSNLQPADYKSAALPIKLSVHWGGTMEQKLSGFKRNVD